MEQEPGRPARLPAVPACEMLRAVNAHLGSRVAAWSLVVGVLLAVSGARIGLRYEPYTFLAGDSPYYAQVAISLLVDRDLDLRNQLKGGLEAHSGEISQGARGEWYPKHPILMPLATVPFLPLFHMNAFLVVNLLVLLGLGVALYELGLLAAGPAAAAVGSLTTILGSFLVLYDYNYSPNLFACLLLTLSVLAALRRRAAAAGLLGGLSTLASTVHLFMLPIVWLDVARKGKTRAALRFAAAAALPLLAQAGLNAHMFGSPLASPYTRILLAEDGGTELLSHMGDFDNPLWEGVTGQVMDPRRGLVWTAPVLFLAAPGYLLWLRARREEAALCLVVSIFLFLLMSRYRLWPTSHQGNRFLMPLVALSAPAVSCTAQWLLDRLLPHVPARRPM